MTKSMAVGIKDNLGSHEILEKISNLIFFGHIIASFADETV